MLPVRLGLVIMVILGTLAACKGNNAVPAPALPSPVPTTGAGGAAGSATEPAPAQQSARPTSTIVATGEPAACERKSLVKLGSGWYPDWSKTNNLIVFDKRVGPLGILEVFTRKPDGTEETCLTCDKQIPNAYQRSLLGQTIHGHRGEASWDPSGRFIVFLALDNNGDLLTGIPGLGANSNVYIMTADGEKMWQLTDILPHRGVGGPRFAWNGNQISWLEEYSCERPTCPQPWLPEPEYRCCAPFDERSLQRGNGEDFLLLQFNIADISLDSDGPTLSNMRTVNVNHNGKRLLDHGSGITPVADRLIFKAADIDETNGRPFCADIYTSDTLGTLSSFIRLTHTPDAHEENTTYSPSGRKIAFTSGPLVGYVFFKLDLYLMDADGSNRKRLTHFNEPGYPEFDNQLHSVDQGTWSPDGTQYLFQVFDHHSKNITIGDWSGNFCSGADMDGFWQRIAWQKQHTADIYLNISANLYLLTFEGPCGAL